MFCTVNLYICVLMTCHTSCCLYFTLMDPSNVCLYICMYIYRYICTYVYIYMYVYMYVCIYVCTYVYMYLCLYTYVYIYVRMYNYICIYVCVYIYMYVCMHILRTYVYVYIYIYLFIYIRCLVKRRPGPAHLRFGCHPGIRTVQFSSVQFLSVQFRSVQFSCQYRSTHAPCLSSSCYIALISKDQLVKLSISKKQCCFRQRNASSHG